jgi:hypothetical protein
VRCDGVYQAEAEGGATEFLRFWGDGAVIWAPVAPTPDEPEVSPDALAAWFNKDYRDFSGGNYSIEGNAISFETKGYAPNAFEGTIEAETLVITRREASTGASFERVFTFAPVAFADD